MNLWEKFTKETPINEVNKNFKTLEADGWCSNGKTLDGPPVRKIEMKLHKGELDIFDDVPFLVKIMRNPEKNPEFLAYSFFDSNNIANVEEWLARIDIDKDRIVKVTHPTPGKSMPSETRNENDQKGETIAA